jgi:hypothetical protein
MLKCKITYHHVSQDRNLSAHHHKNLTPDFSHYFYDLFNISSYHVIHLKRWREATNTFNSEQMLPRTRNELSTTQSYNGHRHYYINQVKCGRIEGRDSSG